MSRGPVRPPRGESREIVELRALRQTQPELASAIDLQIELVDIQRRIQARVTLPRLHAGAQWITSQLRAVRPVVRFEDIPLEWTDFRLALRQNSEALRRHDAIEPADYEQIVGLGRDGNLLEPLVGSWYTNTSRVIDAPADSRVEAVTPGVEHALVLALRPFLVRCGEVLMQRPELAAYSSRSCPICGWEPDFAVITASGDRRLICGRCTTQWAFEPLACPFCTNDDRSQITSFATRDGRYRVYACDVCRRYLKAYDGRNPTRPVMVAVDAIATLPLDAAAMQRGYSG